MKRLILLLLISSLSSLAFSQILSITDEQGNTITNTTVVVELLSSEITADVDGFDKDFQGHVHNSMGLQVDVTIDREVNDIPSGSESYFCVGADCLPPPFSSYDYTIDGNGSNLAALHYKAKGNTEDASVSYRFTSGASEVTLVVEYHVIDDTGINNQLAKNSFLAYPNPANQTVSISYNVSERSEITFYNIVGKQVKSILVDAGTRNIEVETSSLPSGTYFYSMISNSKITETKRLVIKH